ncbi:TVP38/TMEM64 family protein [Mesonia aquimarina]|uniref:TVP38/TMEM64 family protein n=1 Tax=Mesonia aquimarina TaxID=1504967 RepID=UPI000EF5E813|nr:VTT domain-containing protein [Mesonia aquimarina]
MQKNKLIKYSSFLLTGLLVIGFVAAYFISDSFQTSVQDFWQVMWSGDQEKISNQVERFGIWGAVIIILLIILQMFLVVFPSWLPMIVAALVYGTIPSILISSTGVFLASSIGFVIGRQIGDNTIHNYMKQKTLDKLEYWIGNYGFWSIVIFRISPFLSNDAISVIAGGLKMKYLRFISATMLGIIPLATAIALFAENISTLKNGLYWIGGGGILIYAIFIYIDNRKRKKS